MLNYDRDSKVGSKHITFDHARRGIGEMLENIPIETSTMPVIEEAIDQLIARYAFEQSREEAARFLGCRFRQLRGNGNLLM